MKYMHSLMARMDRYTRLAPVTRLVRSVGRNYCRLRRLKQATFPQSRYKVLIVGIYLADRKNFAEHLIQRFNQARGIEIQQAWAAMLKDDIPENLVEHTKLLYKEGKPKFIAINELINLHRIEEFDYIIVCDDDIIIPNNFLDAFISAQSSCDFSIAQPARTATSCGSKAITISQTGTYARQTRFVEIGPLFSVARKIYHEIFPFDENNTMGWGTDYHWPVLIEKNNLMMGIIDSTPVDHSIRGLASAYSSKKAIKEMSEYLQRNPHISADEAQVTQRIIPHPKKNYFFSKKI